MTMEVHLFPAEKKSRNVYFSLLLFCKKKPANKVTAPNSFNAQEKPKHAHSKQPVQPTISNQTQ